MEQVTLAEAQARLAELVAAAQQGEPVYIRGANQQMVQLVPIPLPVPPPRYLEWAGAYPRPRFADEPQPEARKQPQFGNAAGTGGLADDFDEPLQDFAAYRP